MTATAINMSIETTNPKPQIRTILFDFMGTCLDWHSSIVAALPPAISADLKSTLARAWRSAYFAANAARLAADLTPEDIDVTHARTLRQLLLREEFASLQPLFTDEVQKAAVQAWHGQQAWPDVLPALRALEAEGYEVLVHANGTVRLQMDLVRSAGLEGVFEMLFSSQLLGCYKPGRESYEKVCRLLGRGAGDCVAVAAHGWDLRGARAVGMRTVYVCRGLEDGGEEERRGLGVEFDGYLNGGMEGLVEVVRGL